MPMFSAFPQSWGDAVFATVCTVPFLFGPVLALLSAGPVSVHLFNLCPCLSLCLVVVVAARPGLQARVCGDAAMSVAFGVLQSVELAPESLVHS